MYNMQNKYNIEKIISLIIAINYTFIYYILNNHYFVLAPDAADVLPKLSPLKDQIVFEGQPAQFKTQVTPAKPKPTIQWYREGALIPQSPDFQVS